ncbi:MULTISPECIES: SusC/RagA family TonB-linked outer membrane protein [Chitinophagaceae]
MRRCLLVFCLLLTAIGLANIAIAQQKRISGKVLSATDKEPISGAAITFPGHGGGGSTNQMGEFNLTVPSTAKEFMVRGVGLKNQKINITGQQDYTIFMEVMVDTTAEEVVVTAGGFRTKRRELGTSNTLITGKNLTMGKAVSTAAGLQGKVPGLMISGTTGGVNPNYRLILRGQRSLLGNNQALIVLDNVIVPNNILSNLNPEDIESINVLQGAGAAALYGSNAANGALIITTKKGAAGRTNVRVSNTTTIEHVAYWPKMQTTYGAGGSSYGYDANGYPIFSNIENQSYGPPFDGSSRPLGEPLIDGSQLMVPYAANDSRKKFWNTGLTNQTDFSISSGDAISTFYMSGQFVNTKGTTPKDNYKRTALRINGTREIYRTLHATYSAGFTSNRYNITTQTSSIYNNMLNMPSNAPITDYANWQTDPNASPDGYFNPWYLNPYWQIDNYRQKTRNDYLIANVQLDYSPLNWLKFTARQGITNQSASYKTWNAGWTYTDYAKTTSSNSKSNIAAGVSDGSSYNTVLLSDLFMQINTKKNDYSLNFIAGGQWNQTESKSVGVSGSGLVIPGLYNISARTGQPGASEGDYLQRVMGFYGDLRLGYKDFLYLHGTGRNDWTSLLSKGNRSYFYPSVDLSFIASQALDFIKESHVINYLKIRGGFSKIGTVNLNPYSLLQTFSQQSGFPYGSLAGYGLDGQIPNNDLKPEMTKQYEVGFDLNLFNDRITSTATWYHSITDNQIVPVQISPFSGASSYLTNTGKTMSQGLEATLHVTPVRTNNWEVTVGGNYTYLDNKVVAISNDLPRLQLAYYSDGSGSYAVPGQAFPVIMGFDYVRDPEGHIIVDAVTGAPSKDPNLKILGNAQAKNRLGLDASVRFKSITLTALFEYRGGYKMYFGNGSDFDWAGTGIRSTEFNRERFVIPNSVYEDPNNPGHYIKNTTITVQDGNGNAGFWTDNNMNRDITSNYVSSGNFWKLREMAITYNLPQSLFNKATFIKSASISIQGRNLLIWMPKTNYYTDPEYSEVSSDSNGIGLTGISSAPPSRFFGGTITVNF